MVVGKSFSDGWDRRHLSHRKRLQQHSRMARVPDGGTNGSKVKGGTCQHDFSKMSVGVNVRRIIWSLLSIAILITSFFWTFADFSHLKSHLQSGMFFCHSSWPLISPTGSTMVGSWPIGNRFGCQNAQHRRPLTTATLPNGKRTWEKDLFYRDGSFACPVYVCYFCDVVPPIYLQLHNLTLHGNSPPRFELV